MDGYADTLLTVAQARANAGDSAGAEAVLRLMLGSRAYDPEVLYRLARLRRRQGDLDAATRLARAACELAPGDAACWELLGDVLCAQGDKAMAVQRYRQALAIDPDRIDARRSLGLLLIAANHPGEAMAEFEHILRRQPAHVDVHIDLAAAMHRLRRYDDAQTTLRRALAIDPGSRRAATALGYAQLQQGNFAAGWANHEARLNAPDHPGHCFDGFPRWYGNDPAGRTLVLHSEQGIGDTLQFIRYAPLLASRGARVIAAVQHGLAPLLVGQAGIDDLIVPGQDVPPFDMHCPILSLPLAFGTELATIPAHTPYLMAPADRVAAWRGRLDQATGPRIGLTVAGNPGHVDDHNRSVPLADFAALLTHTGAEFHLVQTALRPADQDALRRLPNLRDHSAALADFADTAALLSHMDLVISVDTAVAHLAGALALPTWLLLPFSADWRWLGDDRTDSPWYPAARLFRQRAIGAWQPVLHQVAEALDRWIAPR